MKQVLSFLVILVLILASMNVPSVRAQEQETAPSSPLSSQVEQTKTVHADPPGELIIADMLFLRPVGVAACIVGLAGALVAFPFAAITNSCDRVCNALIVKPFKYTFERRLGQMEYGDRDYTAADMGR
jgi:hypothetical protein